MTVLANVWHARGFWHAAFTAVVHVFPDQPCCIMNDIYLCVCEGVEIVCYHCYEMMMQLSNFVFKPEVVRSYWLSK
jgi:hypothetical protein